MGDHIVLGLSICLILSEKLDQRYIDTRYAHCASNSSVLFLEHLIAGVPGMFLENGRKIHPPASTVAYILHLLALAFIIVNDLI